MESDNDLWLLKTDVEQYEFERQERERVRQLRKTALEKLTKEEREILGV